MANGSGENLLSLLAGGLQGYAQGRMYRNRRQADAEERRKEEERLAKKEEAELEKRNQQIAGQREYTGRIGSLINISPNTPYSTLTPEIQATIDAGIRAGMSEIDATKSVMSAIEHTRPSAPISPLDQIKLQLEQQKLLTEQEQTGAAAALTKQREAAAKNYEALSQSHQARAKQLRDEDLVSSINALRLQRAQLVDQDGAVLPGREAEYNEIQLQLDAYNKENATRKGVTITPSSRRKAEIKTQVDKIVQSGIGIGDPAVVEALKQGQTVTQVGGVNPGSFTPGQATIGQQAGQPSYQEGMTATNPQTGKKLVFRNGQWQRME